MADENLKRDQNHVTVLGGITDNAAQEIRMLRVDPLTGRLVLSMTGVAVSATIDVGTTTTLVPGSAATAVNSGTTSAAIVDFGIPAGSVIYSTILIPDNAVGVNGDWAFSTAITAEVFYKSAGAWALVNSVRGATGATGATGAIGPIGITWKGTYGAGTAYVVNDGVALNGTSYICIQNGTGQTPDPAGTAYWSVLALKGTDGAGTVTSVAAITLGTTGTDLSSTVANGTTTPVITLQVPTASATNRGALSAADWSTFNNKITNNNAEVGYADLDTVLDHTAYYGWVGASDTSASAVPTSDGATVTLTVQKLGGGDMVLIFSTGPVTVDCTPALTLALTAGSDASPTLNYVYIRAAAPTVLTGSTTGFPTTEEFFPIGTYLVQSAATAQTYGIYKAHNWTDHIWKDTTQNGHLAHINKWIRTQPATYQSGVALTPTLTAASPDTLTFATTAGVVLQLHDHTFPAFNSATAGTTAATTFFVVNKNADAYDPGKDLYNYKLTSAGGAAANNDRISWVIWGVVSQETADCKIMVNLPSGFYTSDAAAIANDSRFANYNIPDEYTGTGFLIAKLTYKYNTTGGGDLTLVENVDLRGMFPTIFAGGTAALGTTFADNTFQIYDEADSTKIIAFQASGITTGNTRTLTVPDTSGTLPVGTGTANEIAYWSATNVLGTLAVATYPSLTELTYVKGVTSAIQTQITARLPLAGGTMTGKTISAGRTEVGKTYAPATGAQTVALDASVNNMHIVSGHASGTAITFTITGMTDSQPIIVSILQGGTTVSTITAWFATVRWAGGVAPTLTATLNKRDTFGFIRTGANTYDGFIIGQNA